MEVPDMNVDIQRDGTTLTVVPEGRIDTLTAPDFLKQMEPELVNVKDLIIDFSKVSYISSAGLRVLLAFAQTMEDRDGTIKAVSVSDFIRKVFELTGFLEIMNVD